MIRAFTWFAWLTFALLVVAGGWLALAACEFRPIPIYAYAYCSVRQPSNLPDVVAERERERALQSRIRTAAARLAAMPACQSPTPPPIESPKPTPADTPAPTPTPTPTPSLMMPKHASDLAGCWRSDSGDLQIITDDEKHTPVGKVRVCFCFDQRGVGSVLETYADGDSCRGPLTVQLQPDNLKMHHGVLSCTGAKGRLSGEDISCHGGSGAAASCSSRTLGRYPGGFADEGFHRVTEDECHFR